MISQVSQGHQPNSSIDNNALEVSTELISDHPISYRRSDSMNENILSHRPASPADIGLARSLTTRDSFQHYGIAEVHFHILHLFCEDLTKEYFAFSI